MGGTGIDVSAGAGATAAAGGGGGGVVKVLRAGRNMGVVAALRGTPPLSQTDAQ